MKRLKRLPGVKILVVDDEPDLRDVISSRFELEGCEVTLAENGQSAIDAMKAKRFDAVVTDVRMPGGNGIELLDAIKDNGDQTAVILISGFTDLEPKDALTRGAKALLIKPFDLDDIINAVCSAISKELS
jgi:two-component system response regulator PilR (NtrC family)